MMEELKAKQEMVKQSEISNSRELLPPHAGGTKGKKRCSGAQGPGLPAAVRIRAGPPGKNWSQSSAPRACFHRPGKRDGSLSSM